MDMGDLLGFRPRRYSARRYAPPSDTPGGAPHGQRHHRTASVLRRRQPRARARRLAHALRRPRHPRADAHARSCRGCPPTSRRPRSSPNARRPRSTTTRCGARLPRLRSVGRRRAHGDPRQVRDRRAAGVLHVRARPVPVEGPRPALRRRSGPHPSPGRLLLQRSPAPPRSAHPLRRHRTGARGARGGAGHGLWRRPRQHHVTLEDDGAEPQCARSVLGAAAGGRRPLREPHRHRRQAGAHRLPRERPTVADRLPRRRREHPLQGLHQHRLLARELPLRPRPRRCVRALPALARRFDRAGRRVAARHAEEARRRHAVRRAPSPTWLRCR